MAFIVKGMEMPTCCDMCEFCIQDFDLVAFCCASNIYWINISDVPYDKRHPACPLIEIPKDAKLVDANELLDKSEWYGEKATYDNPMPSGEEAVPVECINDAVIINTERDREDDIRRSD